MANHDDTQIKLEQAKLQAVEAKLVAKYGDKIVQGTTRRAPEGSKYGTKCLVTINTRGLDGEFDGNTREVATSDVFQVHNTVEVATELRKLKAKEKRAQAKAEREANKPKKAKEPKAKEPKAKETSDEAAATLGL